MNHTFKTTAKELINAVKQLAQENPETIYDSDDLNPYNLCFYTKGVTPSGVGCILGQALKKVGAPDAYLQQLDSLDKPFLSLVDLVAEGYLKIDNYSEDSKPVLWLNKVQTCQDSKEPWGIAVDTAFNCYPSIKEL